MAGQEPVEIVLGMSPGHPFMAVASPVLCVLELPRAVLTMSSGPCIG